MSLETTPAVEAALHRVLHPLSWQAFCARYWEREPLHIERADAAHFATLLGIADVESMLSTQSLRYPDVQLSAQPAAPPVGDYTDARQNVLPARLLEAYETGATIVMSGAHRLIPSLASFQRALLAGTGLRCQTNLYLTPPASRGFSTHYDSHDVFVLQIHGSKTFRFHDGGVDLPYGEERFDAGQHKPGGPGERICLQAGDTLYIPRGVFHDAQAGETDSLHVTLGMHAVTWRDVLLMMIEQRTSQDPRYRQSVPEDLWQHTAAADASIPALDPVQRELLFGAFVPDEQAWLQARNHLLNEAFMDSGQDCSNLIERAMQPPSTTGRFRLDPNRAVSFDRQGPVLWCRLPGQVLCFEEPMASAVQRMMSGTEVLASDWTGLDTEQQQALFQRLRQAGLIEPVDDAP